MGAGSTCITIFWFRCAGALAHKGPINRSPFGRTGGTPRLPRVLLPPKAPPPALPPRVFPVKAAPPTRYVQEDYPEEYPPRYRDIYAPLSSQDTDGSVDEYWECSSLRGWGRLSLLLLRENEQANYSSLRGWGRLSMLLLREKEQANYRLFEPRRTLSAWRYCCGC